MEDKSLKQEALEYHSMEKPGKILTETLKCVNETLRN